MHPVLDITLAEYVRKINILDTYVLKKSLSDLIGTRIYSLYRYLMTLGSNANGEIQIGIECLRGKLRTVWSRQKRTRPSLSRRTLMRWLGKLEKFGLIVPLGLTTNGHRQRQVIGEPVGQSSHIKLPKNVAITLTELKNGTRMALRNSRRKPDVGEQHITSVSNSGTDATPVVSEEELSLKGKRKSQGSSGDSGEARPPISEEQQKREILDRVPAAPEQLVTPYERLPFQSVRSGDSPDHRVKLMLRAWRAAVHRETGEECAEFSNGCSRRIAKTLADAAEILREEMTTPHAYAAAYVLKTKRIAQEKEKPFKIPRPSQMFHPNVVRKNVRIAGYVRKFIESKEHGKYRNLCLFHRTASNELYALSIDPRVSLREMESKFGDLFPQNGFSSRYENFINQIRTDSNNRRMEDLRNARLGKWVWA